MPVTTRSQTKKLTSSNEEPKIYVSESLKIMTQLLEQIDNEKDFDKRMILIQNAYKYIYQNITIVLQKERIGDWIIFLDMCIDKIKKLFTQFKVVELFYKSGVDGYDINLINHAIKAVKKCNVLIKIIIDYFDTLDEYDNKYDIIIIADDYLSPLTFCLCEIRAKY